MFKTKGGGVNGRLNNVQKNYKFGEGGHPLLLVLLKGVIRLPTVSTALMRKVVKSSTFR